MANFTYIPFLNPLKFVPSTTTPGVNFDDDWSYNQIKEWQIKVCWHQRWVNGVTTPLIIHSTIAPASLKIYNSLGVIVNSISWTMILTDPIAGNYYMAIFQLDTDSTSAALPNGVYYPYIQVTNGGSYDKSWIGEPVEKRASWKNTNILSYTNTTNKGRVLFGAYPIVFNTLQEAQLLDFLPESDTTDYINQVHDAEILNSTPYRSWKLKTSNAAGMPDYSADLFNRILSCDTVRFGVTANNPGKLITKVSGAKWEPQRSPGYPLAGWAIDVTETINEDSIGYTDVNPLIPGFINAWMINNDIFGGTTGANATLLDKKTT